MRAVINASNLHFGGGVQVATSVVDEVLAMPNLPKELSILVSTEVRVNLGARGNDPRLSILDVHGFAMFDRVARKAIDPNDKVFTVFGPLYRWRAPFQSIVGFAQPWIIYPQNECYRRLSTWQQSKLRAKFALQSEFFRRAEVLVVELEHVREGLVRELGIDPERIHVVRNCLSALFLDPRRWKPLQMPVRSADLRLGFLGRNYPHKNTAILPDISAALKREYGIAARFAVTFTPEEWEASTPEFRAVCDNVGPLTVAQCPSFYAGLDGVIFPSLLECFSATPLEAMAMQVPLFASDRPFNRDVCGPHAHYFDPLNPEDAASRIASVFGANPPSLAALSAARTHALSFGSAAERARRYLEILFDT